MSDTEDHWAPPRLVRPFEQEVYLNLVRTAEFLSVGLTHLCKRFGISPFQLNILRILRGAGPRGLASLSIADRMVNRIPDVTRVIDRLLAQGLVARQRSTDDGRVVLVRLTEKGLQLLADMDEPLRNLHVEQLRHMSREELEALDDLLRVARESAAAPAIKG
jgi:DNA-binding MarR family transcriptional regulator